MIKKIVLLSFSIIASKYLIAQTTDVVTNNENGLAILLTLGVAISALVLAVVNSFRISYYKKVTDVTIVNQIDDINVTIEAVKVGLSRDLRNLRKEMGKNQRTQNPNQTHNHIKEPAKLKEAGSGDVVLDESQTAEKKPFKKRSSNYRRRPAHRKPQDKNNETETSKE